MPRAYTIATAALALDASGKWIDNLLSHYRLAGVVQARQGIARRLHIEGLLNLLVILELTRELGVTVGAAVKIAQHIAGENGVFVSPGGIRLELDLQTMQDRLLSRLEHAVEVAPLPRRGRPPKNTTGRL